MNGRSAQPDDVKAFRAVFVMREVTGKPGASIDIPLPQYGVLYPDDPQRRTPILALQAESDGERRLLGYCELEGGDWEIADFDEVELLGTVTPAPWPA